MVPAVPALSITRLFKVVAPQKNPAIYRDAAMWRQVACHTLCHHK